MAEVEAAEWKEAVEEIQNDPSSESYSNLHSFWEAQAKRQEATQTLSSLLESTVEDLKSSVDKQVSKMSRTNDKDNVVAKEIEGIARGNTNRRDRLLAVLQRKKEAFDMTHDHLLAAVMNEDSLDRVNQGGDDENSIMTVTANNDAIAGEDLNYSPCGSIENADWQELLNFEPSREKIEAFLQARAGLDGVDERFQQTLQAVKQSLSHYMEQVEIITAHIYEVFSASLDDQEEEIHQLIVSNQQRRVAMEQQVQLHSVESQSYFSRLLTSVKSCASGIVKSASTK